MATRKYRAALESLSKATGTPLPSLITSFAILHELTAIGMLIPTFFVAKALGIGETLVETMDGRKRPPSATAPSEGIEFPQEVPETSWVQGQLREWTVEGEEWATRVGRRYGVFGFEKGAPASQSDVEVGSKLVGDVANAVAAYGITKVKNVLFRQVSISSVLNSSLHSCSFQYASVHHFFGHRPFLGG